MVNCISVVIPAYNEAVGIGPVIDNIKKNLKRVKWKYEILVIDDGSKDETARVARVHKVKVIQHPYNLGYGAALKTGIRNAKYETILITDADGTYPPDEIPGIIRHVPDFDMIIGVRTKSNQDNLLVRKPLRWITNRFATYLSGRKISDVNSGMRVFKKSFIEEIMHKLPDGFSFTTTSTLLAINRGLRIIEVPIRQEKRVGASKLKVLKDGVRFPIMMIKIAAKTNPSKVFVPLGLFFITLGVVYGIYTVALTGGLGDLTTLSVMTGVQVLLFGLLADILKD